MRSFSDSYKAAGVDIEAGYAGVKLMRGHVERTNIPGVISGLGGFGGLFAPDLSAYRDPVLVSGTDGVGTKIRIAQLMNRHDTVGVDCVAMCVNDVLCCGAKPLFFLDYIAIGKNEPEKVASIVSGVAEGCVQAGCALLGGETAEHPGIGNGISILITVGIVDRARLIDNTSIVPGDAVIALPSSGLHSNGFSLVRKVFHVETGSLTRNVPELGCMLGEALLTPTKIYVKPVLRCLETLRVKGISHITGGGFQENIPRCLPKGVSAKLDKASIRVPPVFRLLQDMGHIPERDMFNTFNMGVGMTMVVAADIANRAVELLREEGCQAYVFGEIVAGDEGVILC